MAAEKDLEDAIAKYPELIEDGLRLTGRQTVLCGRRIDLLFEDRFRRNLLVELKWGPIKDQHIGQLMSYVGMLLSGDNPDLRVMLIGTRVPPNLQRALDFHGIAWKEMKVTDLLAFLLSKQDVELARAFEGEVSLSPIPTTLGSQGEGSPAVEAGTSTAAFHDGDAPSALLGSRFEAGQETQNTATPKEPRAELMAVVNAYGLTAEPDLRVRDGSAPNYRQIYPAEWHTSYLHYEFYQTRGHIGAELHLASKLAPSKVFSIGEYLKGFVDEAVANGKGKLEWRLDRHAGRGCLAAIFPLNSSPETIAAAMRDLILMTRSGVSERL